MEPPRLRITEPTAILDGTQAVVFLTVIDAGGADQLMGATSPSASTVSLAPGDVTRGLQPISMPMPGMTMHMSAVPIPAHGVVVLERHGPHLELSDVRNVRVGHQIEITLAFARAGPIRVEAHLAAEPNAMVMPMTSQPSGMPVGGQDAMTPGGQGQIRPAQPNG